jgi:flagellar basal-body rod modification protein FlgD
VRTFDLGELATGTHEVAWDGRNSLGQRVPAGTYTIQVAASDAEGNALSTALPVVIGTVESLSYQNGAAYFNVGGTRAPIAALIEVLNATPAGDVATL